MAKYVATMSHDLFSAQPEMWISVDLGEAFLRAKAHSRFVTKKKRKS